jgi:hypothetical protein
MFSPRLRTVKITLVHLVRLMSCDVCLEDLAALLKLKGKDEEITRYFVSCSFCLRSP